VGSTFFLNVRKISTINILSLFHQTAQPRAAVPHVSYFSDSNCLKTYCKIPPCS
jgi:hypothetical protein